jgi:hypothetical protein
VSASYPQLTALRRPAAFVDQPTQLAQPVAVPAPTVGPAPAGHPHHPGPDGDRHPDYGWLLIARDLRAPADHRMPRRPVDAPTAVIPAVHASPHREVTP